jgi:hypothetical protein
LPLRGLGSPLPHLRRDWAHPCQICSGTGLTPATSAPGLDPPLSPSAPRLDNHAKVTIELIGTDKSSGPHRLRDSDDHEDKFERGHRDTFHISFRDIGEVPYTCICFAHTFRTYTHIYTHAHTCARDIGEVRGALPSGVPPRAAPIGADLHGPGPALRLSLCTLGHVRSEPCGGIG